jgi:hypothetical protein
MTEDPGHDISKYAHDFSPIRFWYWGIEPYAVRSLLVADARLTDRHAELWIAQRVAACNLSGFDAHFVPSLKEVSANGSRPFQTALRPLV